MVSALALHTPPTISSQKYFRSQSFQAFGSAFGRTFKKIGHAMAFSADHFFRCAVALKENPYMCITALHFIGDTLSNIQDECGNQRFGAMVTRHINDAGSFVYAILLFGDFYYFYSKQYKTDNALSVAGEVFYAIGDIIAPILWLEEMGFKLSHAVQAIGNFRVLNGRPFKYLPKVPLGAIADGTCFAAYGIYAAEALYRLASPKAASQPFQREKRIKALLDLASYVSSIAGIVFGWAGVVSLPVVIGTGAISTAFWLAGFFYGKYKEKELDS